MPEVESVEYNGITFRRYPNADRRSDRVYYKPSGTHIKNGVEALHREVWKDANDADEIPGGHVIHHIDGDPTNNDPNNLECVTPREHAERHPEVNLSPEDIEKGIEAAKDWHSSEEGREWHSNHWEESLADVFGGMQKECDQCGDEFTDNSPDKKGRYCSNACKAKARRERGDDDEERICPICRQSFTVNKYSDTETCSRRCGGALKSWKNRVQSDG